MTDIALIEPVGPLHFREAPLREIELAALDDWWLAFSRDRPFLYNGDLLACSSCRVAGNQGVQLDWYRTQYAHYLQRLASSPVVPPARALFCSVLLMTEDGRLAVGRMADGTASPGRLQLPGGNITPTDSTPLTLDHCAHEAARELQEELGFLVEPNDLHLWRIKVGGSFDDVGLMFKCKGSFSAATVGSIFERHCTAVRAKGLENEFQELILVDPSAPSTRNLTSSQVDYLEQVLHALKESE